MVCVGMGEVMMSKRGLNVYGGMGENLGMEGGNLCCREV